MHTVTDRAYGHSIMKLAAAQDAQETSASGHLDAGADHVPMQVLTSPEKLVPALTELAGPLGLL